MLVLVNSVPWKKRKSLPTEEYSVQDLTPPALTDIIEAMGGGMVQSIVFAAEIATLDGDRRFMAVWDNESSIANQIGLTRLLSLALDERGTCGWHAVDDEIEGNRGD